MRGVVGQQIKTLQGDVVPKVVEQAKNQGLIKSGRKICLLQSSNEGTREEQNEMKIYEIQAFE